MASLGQTYNNADAPASDYDLIPDRTQATMQIVEADVGKTKAGDGRIMTTTVEIMDGPFENRRIWLSFNISNPNATAQNIALQQLAQLSEALGLPGVSDTDELLWKPFLGTVGIQKSKDSAYPDKNSVRKFAPLNGPAGAAPQRQQQAAPQQQRQAPPPQSRPGGSNGRPWGQQRASA